MISPQCRFYRVYGNTPPPFFGGVPPQNGPVHDICMGKKNGTTPPALSAHCGGRLGGWGFGTGGGAIGAFGAPLGFGAPRCSPSSSASARRGGGYIALRSLRVVPVASWRATYYTPASMPPTIDKPICVYHALASSSICPLCPPIAFLSNWRWVLGVAFEMFGEM